MSEVIEPKASDIVISMVPQEFLSQEFVRNGVLVAKAAKTSRGRFEAADLYDEVFEGRMTMWVVAHAPRDKKPKVLAVIFTAISVYPRMTALSLRYAAGNNLRSWWVLAYQSLEQYAKDAGCDVVEAICRPGWGKLTAQLGIKPTDVVIEWRL